MDHRVFQPPPDNSAAHRRSAIRMALAALLAGLLALNYLKHEAAAPGSPVPPAQTSPGVRP